MTSIALDSNAIETLAAQIAQRMADKPAKEYWSVADIAEVIGKSTSHVYGIIKKPDFPKPFRIPTTDIGRGTLLYKPDEVRAWIERHRDR